MTRERIRTAAMIVTWLALCAAWLLAVRLFVGCAPVEPPPPTPPLDQDAGDGCEASEAGPDACGIAARHVVCELGCEGYRSSGLDRVLGNADDDSFAAACRVISFNTTCLASARDCAEAELCE